jgi:hypothetical protein
VNPACPWKKGEYVTRIALKGISHCSSSADFDPTLVGRLTPNDLYRIAASIGLNDGCGPR